MTLHDQMPTVGIMAAGGPDPVENFKVGMRDCGLIEGQTVRYELRAAHGDAQRLFGFAGELVRASVDLIAAVGAVTARAARKATQDVPLSMRLSSIRSATVWPAHRDGRSET